MSVGFELGGVGGVMGRGWQLHLGGIEFTGFSEL